MVRHRCHHPPPDDFLLPSSMASAATVLDYDFSLATWRLATISPRLCPQVLSTRRRMLLRDRLLVVERGSIFHRRQARKYRSVEFDKLLRTPVESTVAPFTPQRLRPRLVLHGATTCFERQLIFLSSVRRFVLRRENSLRKRRGRAFSTL